MYPESIEVIGTILFCLAVIHTFFANHLHRYGNRFPEGSMRENLFHFLGEVEAIFGIWAGIFIFCYSLIKGFVIYDEFDHSTIGGAIHYLESIDFTEPVFVFVIMCMASSRPIVHFSEKLILLIAQLLPFDKKFSFYLSALIIGPLLGSFITEPAAMTVTGLILLDYFYSGNMSNKFKYATLGLLFVNVSVGGTLTHFAAPPVLIVAAKYGWGIEYMFLNFGYKAAISVVLGTVAIAFLFKKELSGELEIKQKHDNIMTPPWWIILIHIIFVFMVVKTAHHMVFFLGIFLFFLGFVTVSKEYQDDPKIKGPLLVGFFLAGLVTLGKMQAWWLQEVLASMDDLPLFISAAGLTAFTDNAALTYLGSLVDLSDSAKYNLVAGAVAGGGLTVIANAPNPAGYGILKGSFDGGAISPIGLLKGAIFPTVLILFLFQLLPNLY